MRGVTFRALVFAAVLATTACAAENPDAGSSPPWHAPDGEVLIRCYHAPAFPASRVADGGLDVPAGTVEEIVTALAELKDEAGIDAPRPLQQAEADEVTWAVLWSDGSAGVETMGLLLASPGSTGFALDADSHVILERQDGRLRVTGSSDSCGARPALPAGSEWAQIALPDRTASPDGTSVDVLVSEVECTSARDPEPYLAAEPVIVETDEDVTVYWTTEEIAGGATCPGNPWVERTLRLDRPLGERELLDGSTWPHRPVTTVAP